MSALDELRENFRAAAQRDIEARARARRRRRRTTGLLATILVGGAAAAGAADLISVGEPAKDPVKQGSAYQRPSANRVQIVLRADSGLELPYGLGVYAAKNHQECAQVGYLRAGVELGDLSGGKFRPYGKERGASCRQAGKPVTDVAQLGSRYLVYGLAEPGARAVTLRGKSYPTGPRGAFLLVFDGQAPANAPPVKFSR